MIDAAILTMTDLPAGFNWCQPKALENIEPAQLLELADHYGVEPERVSWSPKHARINIGSIGGVEVKTTIPVHVQPQPPVRELLATPTPVQP